VIPVVPWDGLVVLWELVVVHSVVEIVVVVRSVVVRSVVVRSVVARSVVVRSVVVRSVEVPVVVEVVAELDWFFLEQRLGLEVALLLPFLVVLILWQDLCFAEVFVEVVFVETVFVVVGEKLAIHSLV